MSDQPQYYRITDPLESLSIRVRLKKIFGRSMTADETNDRGARSGGGGHGRDRVSFKPGDEADIRVKWQEKVFGPQEILTIAGGTKRHRNRSASHENRGSLLQDYAGQLEDITREGIDVLSCLSEVMLFTYTDRDGFVPPATVQSSRFATGEGGQLSHLEEAVVNLPRSAASSASAGASRQGDRKSGQTLSETASAIQAHLLREDKFKVMCIMAAVDVDVRRMKRIAKGRKGTAFDPAREGPWTSAHEQRVPIHEQVLCCIKAHHNGTLEVTPGFSTEEPESGDEGAFLPDHTVKVIDKEGARLTTYQFTSSAGGVYSFTVENDAEPAGGVEDIEAWEVEESLRNEWKKATRQQAAGTQLFGAPPEEGATTLHAFMEVVSASGFVGVQRLYAEYALSLPRKWRMAANDGGDTGDDRCGGGNSQLDWINEGMSDPFAAGGTTQVAYQAYPLALPHRRLMHPSDGGTYSDTSTGCGDFTMPPFLYPSSNLAPGGAARRTVGFALLFALGLLLALDGSHLCFFVFVLVILVIVSLGGGAGGAGSGQGPVPVAHFGYPAEFHLVNTEEGDLAGLGAYPQIFVAVSSLDGLDRHRVEGYGYFAFPKQTGAHELLIRTWRPVSSVRKQLQDFFIGGAHRLNDPRYASTPGGFNGSFLSRFGFRTESSGMVRVRIHLASQVRAPESRAGQASASGRGTSGPSVDLAGTRTVKEILRVVNAKRLSAEIGRRLSGTAGSTTSASAAAAAAAAATGSTAPAAEAGNGSANRISNSGLDRSRVNTSEASSSQAMSQREDSTNRVVSRLPLPAQEGHQVKSAMEVLARVRGQLEQSERRTKGRLKDDSSDPELAPPR